MNRRTLKQKIDATLRSELTTRWGLPMDKYTGTVSTSKVAELPDSMDLRIVYTHRKTGATIIIDDIIANMQGDILQTAWYKLS